MIGREIRRLSEAEVISRWADLYVAGKHAGRVTSLPASQYLGRDSTWVEVEVPHAFYNADWNADAFYNADWNADELPLTAAQISRATRYAEQGSPLPPGMAGFKGRRGAKRLFVSDGNHRAYAALLRGSDVARFYVPLAEWQRFQATHQERHAP